MDGITLDEAGGAVPWRRVHPRLATGRRIAVLLGLAPVLLGAGVLAWVHPAWGLPVLAGVIVVLAWVWWLVGRQVAAISYVELEDDLVVRTGRVWRTLSSIPYGRIQYVDLSAGPIARRLGYARLEVHTASPSTSGVLPGLPTAEAERLRARLSDRGEALRAGL